MKNTSAISKLDELIWNACVKQKPADNDETVRRWQTDDYSYLKESFIVYPMPTNFNESVQNALAEWYEIEKRVCDKLNMSRGQFLDEFEKARDDFLKKGKLWKSSIIMSYNLFPPSVRNMNWVNLFSWILPYADKPNSNTHREIGRMVTALFYVEMLYKHGDEPENYDLKRIEARWRIVNESG